MEQPDGSLVIGKKALADAVRTTEYDGLTGKITFDEKGDPKTDIHMLAIRKVENGAFKYAGVALANQPRSFRVWWSGNH